MKLSGGSSSCLAWTEDTVLSTTSRTSHRGRSPYYGKKSDYDHNTVHGQEHDAHEVISDGDSKYLNSHYTVSEPEHGDYEENTHSCHEKRGML